MEEATRVTPPALRRKKPSPSSSGTGEHFQKEMYYGKPLRIHTQLTAELGSGTFDTKRWSVHSEFTGIKAECSNAELTQLPQRSTEGPNLTAEHKGRLDCLNSRAEAFSSLAATPVNQPGRVQVLVLKGRMLTCLPCRCPQSSTKPETSPKATGVWVPTDANFGNPSWSRLYILRHWQVMTWIFQCRKKESKHFSCTTTREMSLSQER